MPIQADRNLRVYESSTDDHCDEIDEDDGIDELPEIQSNKQREGNVFSNTLIATGRPRLPPITP